MLASLLRSLVVTALALLAACGESESPGAPDALPSRSAVAAEVESARSTLDSVDSRDGRLASGPVRDVMPDVPEDAVVVQVVRADGAPAEDVPVLGVEVGRDGRRIRGARLRAGTRTDALGRAVMRKGRQGAVYAAGLFGERPVLSAPDEPFLIELPPCGALHVDLSKFDGRQPLEIRMGASLVRRTPRAPCVEVHRSVPLGETLHIELGRGAAALQVDLRGPTREGEVVSWAPSPPRLLEVRARCVDEEGKPLELERPYLMWRAGDADAAGSDAPIEDDVSGAPPDPADAFASMHALPLVPDGRGPGYVSGTVAQGDWPTDRGAMLELRPSDAGGRFQWFDLGEDYAVFVEGDGFERQALADVAEGARVALVRKAMTEQD